MKVEVLPPSTRTGEPGLPELAIDDAREAFIDNAHSLPLPAIAESYDASIDKLLDIPSNLLLNRRHWALIMSQTMRSFKRLLHGPLIADFWRDGQEFECLPDFAKAFHAERFIAELEGAVQLTDALQWILFLVDTCISLFDPPSPEQPSPSRDYSSALRDTLRVAQIATTSLYRLPAHRPLVQEDRNRGLWQLKRLHPKWSWAAIGLRFNISPGAAERAYRRYSKNERNRLLRLYSLSSNEHAELVATVIRDVYADSPDFPASIECESWAQSAIEFWGSLG
jgi:hypothetical protein